MDDDILHGSGGAKDPTTKSTRTDAPALQSLAANRAARLEYRDLLIGWANEMGYGSIYRNEVASQPHSQASAGSSPSRQSGMVQPVVQEMLATVHAAGSSLFGLFSSEIISDSTQARDSLSLAQLARGGGRPWPRRQPWSPWLHGRTFYF
eukprot:scaffold4556_cov114-Isochrysis_galbana.AAC.1